MASAQALKEGVEAFLQQLTERAQRHDTPIERTLWQHDAAADMVELTVVSRRKSYIFSLPATDFTDPLYADFDTEVIGLLLTTIKDNIPLVGRRVPPPTPERDRPHSLPSKTASDGRVSPQARERARQ